MLTKYKKTVVLSCLALILTSCGQAPGEQIQQSATINEQDVLGASMQQESETVPGQVTLTGAVLEPAVLNPDIDTVLDNLIPEEEQPMHQSY